MRDNCFYMSVVKCLTIALLLLFLPLICYSYQLFHTIQSSSFTSVADAQKQFDSIVNKLDENELDNLRIEKIGKFYSVRLGKFKDYTTSENFLKAIKPKLSKATVMKAYIKDERIIKIYTGSSSVDKQWVQEKPLSSPIPEKTKTRMPKKADKKDKDVPLKENIAKIAALVDKKDFNAAMEIITAEIAAQPEHPDLNAWLGMVLIKMDQPLDALKYLKKATELSPNVSDYHNSLGYSLFFLNRFDKAIDEFNKAISLDPRHFDALTGLCIVYAKSGKKEKALDIYNKLKDLDKETSDKLLKIIEMTM